MRKLFVFTEPGAEGLLRHDTGHWTATMVPDTDPDGRPGYSFSFDETITPNKNGAGLRLTLNGRVIADQHGILWYKEPTEPFMHPNRDALWFGDDFRAISPSFPEASPISVAGLVFVKDGQPWTLGNFTSFDLFQRWLDGDTAGVAAWCEAAIDLGANCLRCFGMWYWRNPMRRVFSPAEYGEHYWQQIAPFLHVVNQTYGLHVEWTGLTDCQILLPTLAEQVAYTQRAMQEVFAANPQVNFYEIGNEPFGNGFDDRDVAAHVAVPVGMLVAPGSYDAPPHLFRLPAPSYGTDHTTRDDHWMAKAKELGDQRAFSHVPEVGDEPVGAAEYEGNGRSNQPFDFFDYAANAALLGNGACFHHDEHYTRVEGLTPTIKECGRQFFAALHQVPATMTQGSYTAGHHGDCPLEFHDAWSLRTYGRILGGEAWLNVTKPTSAGIGPDGLVIANPRHGWQIVERFGPHGRLMHLQR